VRAPPGLSSASPASNAALKAFASPAVAAANTTRCGSTPAMPCRYRQRPALISKSPSRNAAAKAAPSALPSASGTVPSPTTTSSASAWARRSASSVVA
jgi:hypothetical protein